MQNRSQTMVADNQSVSSYVTAGQDSSSPKAVILDISKVVKQGYLMKKGRFYG